MTDVLIAVAFGLGVALYFWFFWWLDYRETPLRVSKPKPKAETYGHPKDPVAALKKRLKAPPSGYAWELSVVHDVESNNDPILKLGLFNLVTSELEVEYEQNLRAKRKYRYQDDDLWEEAYESGFYGSDACDIMWRFLISPFVEWSKTESAKRRKCTGPEHYELIT